MVVLFIDMDYFFAACEEVRHPELKGRPFVVGTATIAKKERGVVQTCNYEARKYGIHSAMATAQALKLKPDLVYLESDDKHYEEMSGKVMDILRSYRFAMEVISVDEAALDLRDNSYKESEAIAKDIKRRISGELKLPCTIGISTGKIYAKIVCDDSKPDGLGVLRDDELREYLKDKKVDALLGVGRKTSGKLNAMGVKTIGELSKMDPNLLVETFGAFGKELYLIANCRYEGRIIENYNVMSVGRERTLDSETKDIGEIDSMLKDLSREVIEEIKKQGLWFRGISVKARYSDLTERIRNRKLNNYTDSFDTLYNTSVQLARKLATDKDFRKVGVRTYMLGQRKGQRSIF